MTVEFFYLPGSVPCRAVQMALTAVGVPVTEKIVNTLAGEHLSPEFLKMNPQHTIPTIRDGSLVLWESRAIMSYLVNKYGEEGNQLYPKDPVKRALVDQRLYFDMGTLYQRFGDYYFPQLKMNQPADPQKLKKCDEAFELLESFLCESKYVAGNEITIADFAILSTVSTYVERCGYNIDGLLNVQRWYKDAKENVPGYQTTVPGMEALKTYFEEMKKTREN